jgi:hypothetical protein
MNKGIEILLERMDSNPEEFVVNATIGVNKWDRLLHNYASVLDEEDIEAYQAKLKQIAKDQFTAEVMKELLDPKPSEDYWADSVMQTKGITSAGTWANTTATATINANSLTLGSTTLREEKLKQILEQHDLALKHKKRAIPR